MREGHNFLPGLPYQFVSLVVFQGEGNTNDSFLVRVFKLVLNVIAVLLLAGGISFLIKVHLAVNVLIFVNNRIVGSDWSRLSADNAGQCTSMGSFCSRITSFKKDLGFLH